MEYNLNTGRISKYFALPTLKQTARMEMLKQEDSTHTNTLPLQHPEYLFGIEVEVEGVPHPHIQANHTSYWQITADGSLRNNGIEFVSAPLRASQVEYALDQLFASLPITHEFSPRTSTHVHMNVRDLTMDQICGVVLLYTLFEDLLFKWVGGNREKNTFCTKLTDTNYVKMYSQLSQNPQQVVDAWAKYTALNLAPIASKGTIEFRHLCGSINKDYIIGWINLISCLKGMAKKYSAQALSNEICMLNTDSAYEDFAFRVFGKSAVSLLTDGYIESMEHACSYIKLATIYMDVPIDRPQVRWTTTVTHVAPRNIQTQGREQRFEAYGMTREGIVRTVTYNDRDAVPMVFGEDEADTLHPTPVRYPTEPDVWTDTTP